LAKIARQMLLEYYITCVIDCCYNANVKRDPENHDVTIDEETDEKFWLHVSLYR